MRKKTESQFPNLQSHGSHSCTKNPTIGSLSCSPSITQKGTVYYISGGTRERTEASGGSDGPAVVLAFPLRRQLEKVSDVARKLARTTTRRHATYYRSQVTKALDGKLKRLGVTEDHRNREIARFWQAVACEVQRQRRQGGAA
ncbi:DUF6074 family protein [Rhizobium puerariae]|uniref:DUF6074 family protein n=1 Tax=Rhizobium puerariae TaxID=1585791 RepID=A0ABV6ANU6_9HYPH